MATSDTTTVVPDQPNKTDRQLSDPEKPGIPLAWLYKKAETQVNRGHSRVVGSCPPSDVADQYRRLVVLQTKEEWIIHCSSAGVQEFVRQKLGDDNVFIDRQTKLGELVVPDDQMSFWIGKQGTNVGFFRRMLDLKKLTFSPDQNWEKVRH